MNTVTDPAVTAPYRVQGIPATHVALFWHYAEPYIKRALDRTCGELKPEDLRERCVSRDIQLWLVARGERVVGAATTEVVQYPRRRHCRIITLAGSEFDGWVETAHDSIRRWATEQGCDAIESLSRRGFIPKLEKHGFKFKYAVLIDDLGRAMP